MVTVCYCWSGTPNNSSPCSPAATQDVRDPRARRAFRRKRQLSMMMAPRVEMSTQSRREVYIFAQGTHQGMGRTRRLP